MNSSGVPTQGVSIAEATTARKRGSRSEGKPTGYTYGKGTAGKRLRNAHRKWKPVKQEHKGLGLRAFVRLVAKDESDVLQADAKAWLERKARHK